MGIIIKIFFGHNREHKVHKKKKGYTRTPLMKSTNRSAYRPGSSTETSACWLKAW